VTGPHLEVRRVDHHDEEWVRELMRTRWGEEIAISRGRVHRPASLPGFVVIADLIEPVGLLTYSLENQECEVVTIDSLREGIGVGSMLIDAAVHLARDVGCLRVWLITTNDNVHAQAWFERRGLRLAAVHQGAVTASRKLKPSIPLVGHAGLPITDELEYEYPIV
jgi:N-acetylglutamate synthase-like GNAT family acetyltransferase